MSDKQFRMKARKRLRAHLDDLRRMAEYRNSPIERSERRKGATR